MKLLKTVKIYFLILSLMLNGCIAAVPAIYLASQAVLWGTIGYVLTATAIGAASSAKKRHPEVNFDKKWPDCVAFDKDYAALFEKSRQVVIGLGEAIDKDDKENGIIETKKAMFGEPQPVKDDPSKKVSFWQRKTVTITKIGDNQAQACIKVHMFTTLGEHDKEKPLEDEAGVNVVKAIFFDKLEQAFKEKNS